MIEKPKVGQVVRLNSTGCKTLSIPWYMEKSLAILRWKITSVGDKIPVDDADIWDITLSDEDINKACIDSGMFEVVTGGADV